MKVILLKDVVKIGRRSEIVNVPDGFALNKLIPKGMAQAATAENIKRLEHVSSKLAQNREIEAGEFEALLKELEAKKIEITVEANEQGHMFQALKVSSIVDAIKTLKATTFGAEHVVIKTPIKSVGEHVVELVSGKTRGVITITLVAKTK